MPRELRKQNVVMQQSKLLLQIRYAMSKLNEPDITLPE